MPIGSSVSDGTPWIPKPDTLGPSLTHTHSPTHTYTHTQYKKTTELKRKEQRRSYKAKNLERGKGVSQSHEQKNKYTMKLEEHLYYDTVETL